MIACGRHKCREGWEAPMPEHQSTTIKNHAAFIWSVADLLRGDYKQSEYGRVILPLTVIRRLDCVLEPTKAKVLAVYDKYGDRDQLLRAAAENQFYNTSRLTLASVLADSANVAAQLSAYIAAFSPAARDVIEKFDFHTQIARLNRVNLLYLVLGRFCDLDLHPATVDNVEMGYLYEELIRKFSELSNETAGEHFTPREVIRLMVELLFCDDDDLLSKPRVLKTLFDPACGTGGMLSVAEDRLHEFNPQASLSVYGQELNAETYAICRSDMMIKGQNADNIAFGNSFTDDAFEGEHFDYLLANPPFGVEWKKVAEQVKANAKRGFAGPFGAGLPRINDGSFLFLQHMIAKMKRREQGGSRLAIVFNGSPLFTGAAASGESEIRRWIIENDWLEAVVALPDQLFYNTGISTYFWIVTNRKSPQRRGNVQLVDGREFFAKMRKSLGEKRKEIPADRISEIVRLYGAFEANDKVKILPNAGFGFLRITVERPLRLRWEVTEDTLAAFDADPKLAKHLNPNQVAAVRGELVGWAGETFTDNGLAAKRIRDSLVPLGIVSKPVEAALLEVLAVRDPAAAPVTDAKGNIEPDPDLRDYENVPLPPMPVTYEADIAGRVASVQYRTTVDDYLSSEVLPYVPDAWVDHTKTKIGYEIPLTRYFYKHVQPRPLAEIDAEIKQLESEIQSLLDEVTE
jgi:type I restriction enzyme M protein